MKGADAVSVGGKIIEIREMTITAGDYSGKPTRVKRLWCLDARNGYNDETCVYAEWYLDGNGPKLGEEVWWQSGKIFFNNDSRTVRKVAYSFKPSEDE